jgi:hypothetical protein
MEAEPTPSRLCYFASMSQVVSVIMTVLKIETALYAALKFLPEGTRMTVHTLDWAGARTNVLGELRKEVGRGSHDWQIIHRPATADASQLPATWPSEDPAVVSSRTLADTLGSNPALWADVHD